MTTCTSSENIICKHPSTSEPVYVDLTNQLAKRTGVTLTSATVDTTADATLTAGAVSVTVAEISDYDQYGNAITIAIGSGFQFNLAGGTALDDDADPIKLPFVATFSDGSVVAWDLLLKVE